MKRASLVALLLVIAGITWAPAALAQDGGTPAPDDGGTADAGVVKFTTTLLHDGGVVEMTFPTALEQGSVLGAGIDILAPSEIIRPENLQATAAAVRRAGGVLEGGSSSFVLQANPYQVIRGENRTYNQFRQERETYPLRILQDSALTAAIASGTPFGLSEEQESRFATLGLGWSMEFLGSRSIYGGPFARCIEAGDKKIEDIAAKAPLGIPDKNPDETNEAYAERFKDDPRVQKYRASLEQVNSETQALIKQCDTRARDSFAIFGSVGGRWVLPSRLNEEGTGVRIQRFYASTVLDYVFPAGVGVSGQVRALAERLNPTERRSWLLDAGASLSWSSSTVAFSLQATRSIPEVLGGRAYATFGSSVQVKLFGEVGASISVTGTGTDLGNAMSSVTGLAALTYGEEVLTQIAAPYGTYGPGVK
jgi:hypothetical protein